jgi:hypothetical protein
LVSDLLRRHRYLLHQAGSLTRGRIAALVLLLITLAMHLSSRNISVIMTAGRPITRSISTRHAAASP